MCHTIIDTLSNASNTFRDDKLEFKQNFKLVEKTEEQKDKKKRKKKEMTRKRE